MPTSEALSLLIALLNQAAVISSMLTKLAAEGRNTLTAEEWTTITVMDDKARQELVDAIARAKAEGR